MSAIELIKSFIEPASISLALAAFDVDIDPRDGTASFPANPKVTDSTKAVFLKDVKEESTGNLTAKVVGKDELADLLTPASEASPGAGQGARKKPLFCIHGWRGRPDNWINLCKWAEEEAKNIQGGTDYKFIPVLWPGTESDEEDESEDLAVFTNAYKDSRGDATLAAKSMAKEAFDHAFEAVGNIDVLAVSMGNWVLQELAKARFDTNKTFKFDNIFMSAADVRSDIFTRDEGEKIVKMLSGEGKGKIYTFYNKSDTILKASTTLTPDIKWRLKFPFLVPRLGLSGTEGKSNFKEANIIEDKDVTNEIEFIKRLDPIATHGYLFEEFAIEFYKNA